MSGRTMMSGRTLNGVKWSLVGLLAACGAGEDVTAPPSTRPEMSDKATLRLSDIYALATDTEAYKAGAKITVAWAAPSSHSGSDRIGLYKVGASSTGPVDYQNVPAGFSGILTFTASPLGGHFEFRYLPSGGTTSVATSNAFTLPFPTTTWVASEFQTVGTPPPCSGVRHTHYVPAYDKWVGAIRCGGNPYRYKLYMSDKADGTYYELADYSYHGEDHCELVNPTFTLPVDGDIRSGGCTTCALGSLTDPIGVPVYVRGYFGNSFEFRASAHDWGDLSTDWYECGVSIP